MDIALLHQHVTNGVVRAQQHPTLPLTIYNYSERCQYDRLWDDVTLQCRGLVMHGERIVARPFRKFFNDTEHKEDEIPWHLPHVITEKMDGSLLIVFHFDGEWHFCTRGSFTSEQAFAGKDLVQRLHGPAFSVLRKDVTYLFELIYPQNRIVVDYGDKEDVVLIGLIETETGHELPISMFRNTRFSVVNELKADAKDIRALIRDDQEGYVVRFENGFRIKIKGERYKQLHRILSGVSSRMIWEHLSEYKPLDDMLEIVPDEFADWVRDERAELLRQFDDINKQVGEITFKVMDLPTRKDQAQKILSEHKTLSAPVFQLLDGKDPSASIWKMIYPEVRRPAITQRLNG